MASRLTVPFLALALCIVPAVPALAQSPQAASQAAPRAWDDPPPQIENDKMLSKAYKDGIHAVQSDRLMHRRLDYTKSADYRSPPKVHKSDRAAYRRAFQAGYAAALHHAGW